MALVHNLGFPRIGKQRELKYALENYWQGHSDSDALLQQAQALRAKHWQDQVDCDYIPVGDFSLYDHVLDMSFMLGNVPERVSSTPGNSLEKYFRLARGRSLNNSDCHCVRAGEMTKWFDTNYHYIVPELSKDTQFSLRPEALIEQIIEAKALGKNVKPVIIGPVTYLWLSKAKDGSERLDLLDDLLVSYRHLLQALVQHEVEWVQIDEPILVTDLRPQWRRALEKAYAQLKSENIKLLLTTYFGKLEDNLQLACELPADGLHIDTINAKDEVAKVLDWLPIHKVLSLGVVDGRNIWKTDLNKTLSWLQPIAEKLNDRLWLAPSCSLLHVPVDLDCETSLAPEIKNWLAFAVQKLAELKVLCSALNGHCDKVSSALADNAEAITSRVRSHQVHKPEVKQSVAEVSADLGRRRNPYSVRSLLQRDRLKLPLFPTTTIGSFPQTQAIRQARLHFKKGKLSKDAYEAQMQSEIARAVAEQEALGLDVLVHGEAERNDMVAYFGEHLEGCAFSSFGWVQSYGSRCVKPPIIFGDVKRPKTITVDWTHYAQSLTEKPMKGMLTGPVTILNWSFVRDDQPRSETCFQLALALREEVLDLERAGLTIIQIDEAALREGLPLRESKWASYLDWAVESFRICANGVKDKTQIHTHMCYSEFNDIIEAIAHMDADVITIETSRSDMELLDVFNDFNYPNDIGPGVYDIHTPNTPTSEEIVSLMRKAAQRIPIQRLWVNPDCGLKTRRWEEVVPALKAMVDAARVLRASMA